MMVVSLATFTGDGFTSSPHHSSFVFIRRLFQHHGRHLCKQTQDMMSEHSYRSVLREVVTSPNSLTPLILMSSPYSLALSMNPKSPTAQTNPNPSFMGRKRPLAVKDEARALIGKLEYQRGNVKAALRVFEGIDIEAAIQCLQSISRDKMTKNSHTHSASGYMMLLTGVKIYAVEKIFPQGISDAFVDTKLQETISQAVELLPQLWVDAGSYQDAISSYRRALLAQWNLDNDCCARIQNNLQCFCCIVESRWAHPLHLHSQTPVLAKQLEEVIPGAIYIVDLWKFWHFVVT
ncbi:hypothetical protein M8C21_000975 [Ambrosia artemisiifolia]|uniref:Uncharacterized protein n=1 Tax=Ambrosia artemisiifolia TaxID=4212 RepID=A0AAD5G619_AMBAR|nr:hypothetical protein M8C21_000975 [Ambrosia artemisiifolia]